MNESRLTYLFNVYLDKTATEAEREEFMLLLSQTRFDEQVRVLIDKAWEQFSTDNLVFTNEEHDQLLANIISQTARDIPEKRMSRFHRNIIYYTGSAAAAVILFFIGSQLLRESPAREVNKNEVTVAETTPAQPVSPGGHKAVLTLSDGSHIILDTTKEGLLASQGNAKVIRLNNSTLAYNNSKDRSDNIVYNTLSTPNGGQYQLLLPDGSKVWLNASSSIHFPTRFHGKQRQVTVTGEAYFEVAKSKSMPFVISVRDVQIEVLGTAFDVMAYLDESSMNTTLIEGAVKISKGPMEKVLKAGQESRIGKTGEIQVVQAEVEEVIAWKNGWFQFDGYDIEKVMRQISRWYNVEVVYEGKIPAGHFSGIVSRKNDIKQVLKILEAGGVQFKIQGRKVFITS